MQKQITYFCLFVVVAVVVVVSFLFCLFFSRQTNPVVFAVLAELVKYGSPVGRKDSPAGDRVSRTVDWTGPRSHPLRLYKRDTQKLKHKKNKCTAKMKDKTLNYNLKMKSELYF